MQARTMRRTALILATALLATACGSDDGGDGGSADDSAGGDGGDGASGDAVTIDYWLWDGNQQPFYEECATAFEEANPNLDVEISQFAWGDYWTNLTTAFASETAPDVFTNHLARYPEQVQAGVLVPLNDFVEADGVDTDQYFEGLAELWVGPDGSRFGLPKDFDTISVVLNTDALDAAGVTKEDFEGADWNPDDGGSFGELIARLSVDTNGNTGDSPDFDPSSVEQYGFVIEGAFGAFGQTTFSAFAYSNGFEFLDENPFGSDANYDAPELHAAVQWFSDNIEAGYIAPIEDTESLGGTTLFQQGAGATMTNGSWMISTLTGEDTTVPVDFAPLPVGPIGERRSMFNGLADSITQSADDKDAAWQWVKFLASPECQEIVGGGAVVFPAIPSATDIAIAAHEENGVDVSAFTVHVDEGTTFLFPITSAASQVEDLVGPVQQQILRGEVTAADGLGGIADQVDQVLESNAIS